MRTEVKNLTEHACEECQAPLEPQQRYCTACGTRNRNAANPAAEYFSAAGRRRRLHVPAEQQPVRKSWLAVNAPVLLLTILPLAVGVGVLVGKSGDGGGDSKLLAAIRNVKPVTVASAAASGNATNAADTAPASDFSLSKGYTVKLSTTDAAGAAAAERAARAKGASGVGLIAPTDFSTRPSQGSNYVVYSGEFRTRAAAQRVLAKLKKSFPGAQVIQVSAKGGSSAVVSKTQFGTAHQVAGHHAGKQEVQRDTRLVQQNSKQTGKTYVQQQQNLPDQITIGGAPGSSPAPSGRGD
jgi:hypothetical protein